MLHKVAFTDGIMTRLPAPLPAVALALGHTIVSGGRPLIIGVCALALAVAASVCVGTAVWARHTRARQRERRSWLHELVCRFDVALLMTDLRGTITAMNRAAESMTGWQETEAVGLPVGAVFQLVDRHTHERVVNPLLKALYKKIVMPLSADTLLITKDGTERLVRGTAAPIWDGQGHVLGSVLALRDGDDTIGMGQHVELVDTRDCRHDWRRPGRSLGAPPRPAPRTRPLTLQSLWTLKAMLTLIATLGRRFAGLHETTFGSRLPNRTTPGAERQTHALAGRRKGVR
jgi:PAS domain S-box-containing protein